MRSLTRILLLLACFTLIQGCSKKEEEAGDKADAAAAAEPGPAADAAAAAPEGEADAAAAAAPEEPKKEVDPTTLKPAKQEDGSWAYADDTGAVVIKVPALEGKEILGAEPFDEAGVAFVQWKKEGMVIKGQTLIDAKGTVIVDGIHNNKPTKLKDFNAWCVTMYGPDDNEWKDDLRGLIGPQGVILEPKFNNLRCSDTNYPVTELHDVDGKKKVFGLIDNKGTELLPATYKFVSGGKNGVGARIETFDEKNNKGLYFISSKKLIEPAYSDCSIVVNMKHAAYCKTETGHILYDAAGKVIEEKK